MQYGQKSRCMATQENGTGTKACCQWPRTHRRTEARARERVFSLCQSCGSQLWGQGSHRAEAKVGARLCRRRWMPRSDTPPCTQRLGGTSR